MAVSKVHGAQRDAAISGVDLSDSLYRFCVKNASKQVVLPAAGAEVVGVIYGAGRLGRPTTFAMAGTGSIVKVEAGAAIAVNAKIMTNASGQAVTATTGNAAVGLARSSAAAAGDIIEMYFNNVTDA